MSTDDGIAAGAIVELGSVPSLGGLYARGVAGSVRAAAGRQRTVQADALPSTRVAVRGVRADVERLSEYQHLLGETADDVLPAGFVHVLAFPVATALMVRDEFPLPLLGMVHVANRVEQHRPVRLDEALDLEVGAESLRAHRAGVTVDVVAEARVGDEVVWRGVSTYLAKGYRLALQSASTTPDLAPVPGDHDPRGGADQPLVPTGQWRLAADVGRRYATVSGDRNPIHLSGLAAKAFGFPRAIAHGMYTAARALADVGPARGDAFVWEVDFAKPVLLPGTVAVRVTRDGDGHAFVGWNQRTSKRHFSGSVRPLD